MSRRATAGTAVRALTAAATTAALVGGLLIGAASPAQAKKKKPTKPTGVQAIAATPSSLTVRAKVQYGKKFRVYAATTPRAVNASSYKSAPYTAAGRTPTVLLTGLAYRTEPYFLRYTATNSRGMRYSEIATAYLKPPTPTQLTAAPTAASGLALRWSTGKPAERYVVSAATDSGFTRGVVTATVTGEAHTWTPVGLAPDTTYYFRVRAANGPQSSAYSAATTATTPAAGADMRIASYNLLWAGADGTKAGDGVVAPWSKRRQAAAALVDRVRPDVIAVQEGNSNVSGSTRQVDSFAAALGGPYRVAATDPAGERTGPYLVYDGRQWAPADQDGRYQPPSGRYGLPNGRYAAYQVFEHRTSGARVLVVSTHLTPGKASTDAKRREEAAKLADLAALTAAAYKAPVVYAGDFNSNAGKNHKVDGPGIVFTGRGTPDSKQVAPVVLNARYNSANQYYRTPRASGLDIDHIYVEPGIAVTRWQMLLDLDKSGKFAGVIPSDHNPIVADLVLPTG